MLSRRAPFGSEPLMVRTHLTGELVLAALPAPLAAAAHAISTAVATAGGEAWLVGGAVRDAFLGLPVNDLDVEVHGLEASALKHALRRVGRPKAVGRSFGLFKVDLGEGKLCVDVALPRAAVLSPLPGAALGAAAAPVVVQGDPWVGIEAALSGRDLTINAMAVRLRDGALADPWGGRDDLRAGLLRPAHPARFADDPVRVLRAARFAARFGFRLDPSLIAVCLGLPVAAAPPDRRLAELEAILLGPRPGVGIAAVFALDAGSAVLPGLEAAAVLPIADRLPASPDRPPGQALAVALCALLDGRPEAATPLLDGLGLVTRGGFPVRAQVVASWPWLAEAPPSRGWEEDAWLRHGAERLRVELALDAAAIARPDPRWSERSARAWALGVQAAPLLPLIDGATMRALGVRAGPAMGVAQRLVRRAQLDGRIVDAEGAVALVRAALAAGPLVPDGGAEPPR